MFTAEAISFAQLVAMLALLLFSIGKWYGKFERKPAKKSKPEKDDDRVTTLEGQIHKLEEMGDKCANFETRIRLLEEVKSRERIHEVEGGLGAVRGGLKELTSRVDRDQEDIQDLLRETRKK